MSKLKKYLIIAAAVLVLLVILRLVFHCETLWIGLILFFAALLSFLVWKAFIKNGREDLKRSERKGKALEEEVTSLKKQIAGLYRELEEKGRSPLNVVELSPILHLAVMNIDSSFVRTFIREDEDAGRRVYSSSLRPYHSRPGGKGKGLPPTCHPVCPNCQRGCLWVRRGGRPGCCPGARMR